MINQKGLGNGISVLLFAGIVARMPSMLYQLWAYFKMAVDDPSAAGKYFAFVPLFVVLFLAVIWVIIFMNDAERRIPIQYAKRVVGRRMYGGQSTNLGIKVAMSGVMPDHLCQLYPFDSEHDPVLPGFFRAVWILGRILQCLLFHGLAVQYSLFHSDRTVRLFLYGDSV